MKPDAVGRVEALGADVVAGNRLVALRLYQLGIAVPGVRGLSAREALEVVEPPVDHLSRVAVLRNNLVDSLSYVLRAEQELVGVLVAELESEPLAAH